MITWIILKKRGVFVRTNEGKINVNLLIFILMNFALSMTATVFNGILDIISESFNVSIANSGLLNSTYAYGGAIGVPIFLILFRKIERTRMLKIMLAITIVMNLLLIYAEGFNQLLLIRFITGVSASSYAVLATATVAAISSRDKLGRSLALLIMGNALALVIGIPLTRILVSFLEWQSIFWILSFLMIFALLYFIKFLPSTGEAAASVDLKTELAFFKDKETSVVISSTFITFIGFGGFYTYVTPYILELFPSLNDKMSWILMFIGVASFTGNLIGGIFADRMGYAKSLLFGSITQIIFSIIILFTQSSQWVNLIFYLLFQMTGWFIGLQVNTGINYVTENKSSFILSINSSALQLGIAVGASVAALIIANAGIEYVGYLSLTTSAIVAILQWRFNYQN